MNDLERNAQRIVAAFPAASALLPVADAVDLIPSPRVDLRPETEAPSQPTSGEVSTSDLAQILSFLSKRDASIMRPVTFDASETPLPRSRARRVELPPAVASTLAMLDKLKISKSVVKIAGEDDAGHAGRASGGVQEGVQEAVARNLNGQSGPDRPRFVIYDPPPAAPIKKHTISDTVASLRGFFEKYTTNPVPPMSEHSDTDGVNAESVPENQSSHPLQTGFSSANHGSSSEPEQRVSTSDFNLESSPDIEIQSIPEEVASAGAERNADPNVAVYTSRPSGSVGRHARDTSTEDATSLPVAKKPRTTPGQSGLVIQLSNSFEEMVAADDVLLAGEEQGSRGPFNLDLKTLNDGRLCLSNQAISHFTRLMMAIAEEKDSKREMLEELELDGLKRLLSTLERAYDLCDIHFWPVTCSTKAQTEEAKTAAEEPEAKRTHQRGKNVCSEMDEPSSDDELMLSDGDRSDSEAKDSQHSDGSRAPETGNVSYAMHVSQFMRAQQHALTIIASTRLILLIHHIVDPLLVTEASKKQLPSFELDSAVVGLRSVVETFVIPIQKKLSDTGATSDILRISSAMQIQIDTLLSVYTETIYLLQEMIRRTTFCEQSVIALLFYELGPFLLGSDISGTIRRVQSNPSNAPDDKAGALLLSRMMRTVHAVHTKLIQVTLSKYSKEALWILEEIFTSIGIYSTYSGNAAASSCIKLKSGSGSIHIMSALMLTIVQTCPQDLPVTVRARLNGLEEETEPAGILKTIVKKDLAVFVNGATVLCQTLFDHFVKKATSTNSNSENEYRLLLDRFIDDILQTLYDPEWPASELALYVYVKLIAGVLSETSCPASSKAQTAALKNLFLDHIGIIVNRIRTFDDMIKDESLDTLISLTQVIRGRSISEDSALMFYLSLCSQDILELLFFPTGDDVSDEQALPTFNLMTLLWTRDLSEEPKTDAVEMRRNIVRCSFPQRLRPFYRPLVALILNSCSNSAPRSISYKTKALKAFGLMSENNPELGEFYDGVASLVQNTLYDPSPAVRDTAVEVVGKMMMTNGGDIVVSYLPLMFERATDSSISVRKRILKLFKSIYLSSRDMTQKVSLTRMIVWRILDEDEAIRDLAVDIIDDLWIKSNYGDSEKEILCDIVTSVTAAASEDSSVVVANPPVEQMLKAIADKYDKNAKSEVATRRLESLMESLINRLVEYDEIAERGKAQGHTLLEYVRTIYVFNSVSVTYLSTQQASILLPYLKNATTGEEQAVMEYLLKIFRATIVTISKKQKSRSVARFYRELQQSLMPMLNRPPINMSAQNASSILQEIVACFCAVIRGQTHEFDKMVAVFSKCTNKLRDEMQFLKQNMKQNIPFADSSSKRYLPLLLCLTALLTEFGNFDLIMHEEPAMAEEISSLLNGSPTIHKMVYTLLIELFKMLWLSNLYRNSTLTSTVVSSLGFLFRAYPLLLIEERSLDMIDGIFKEHVDPEDKPTLQLQLLRSIRDFLSSQQGVDDLAAEKVESTRSKNKGTRRTSKKNTKVDMRELVGNVDTFADSGVASSICQRYFDDIIGFCLSVNQYASRLAIDIICVIAQNGYAHPVSIAPALVAVMTTLDEERASNQNAHSVKAFSALALLYQKHMSLIATRFSESARMTYDFSRRLSKDVHGTYVETKGTTTVTKAMFSKWYSLVQREKRGIQMDFVKSLSRTFDVDLHKTYDDGDVFYCEYLAENMAALDFARNEEVLMVISYLDACVSVAGVELYQLMEVDQEEEDEQDESVITPNVIRQSLMCGIALVLRIYLMEVYHIKEKHLNNYERGKRSAIGDKSVLRDNSVPRPSFREKLPLLNVTAPTLQEMREHRDAYMDLMKADESIELDEDQNESDQDLYI